MKKLPAVMIFCMASVLKVRTASSSLEKVTSPDEEVSFFIQSTVKQARPKRSTQGGYRSVLLHTPECSVV